MEIIKVTDTDRFGLEKVIKELNKMITERKRITEIQGFQKLIKRINGKEINCKGMLMGNLNHILVTMRFFDNKEINILACDVRIKNGAKGQNPDLLISHKDEEYAIEIKTVNRNDYDDEIWKLMSSKKEFIKIPEKSPSGFKRGKNLVQKMADDIIPQLDMKRKNIVLILSDVDPPRELGGYLCLIDSEMHRLYEEYVQKNKAIPCEHLLFKTYSNRIELIKKYVGVKKLIVFSDRGIGDNAIVGTSDCFSKELLDFLRYSKFNIHHFWCDILDKERKIL